MNADEFMEKMKAGGASPSILFVYLSYLGPDLLIL